MNKNTIRVGLLALGLIGVTQSQAAITVVQNFEDGVNNTGLFFNPGNNPTGQFFSDYTFVSGSFNAGSPGPANASLWPEGTMAEISNTAQVHPLWVPVTTPMAVNGGDRFLAVNGMTTPGKTVWQQAVAATGNTAYNFGVNVTALFNSVSSNSTTDGTADLTFSVEYFSGASVGNSGSGSSLGVTSGLITPPPTTANSWKFFNLSAPSPLGAQSAVLTIKNGDVTQTGNDFGIDYITFDTERQVPVVPEVSTGISAGAFALVGGLIVLRRRKAAQVA